MLCSKTILANLRIFQLYHALLIAAAIFIYCPFISYAELPDILGIIKSDTTHTNFGYRIVPLGDQNDDGFDDILIWDFRYSAYIYYGGNPFDTVPAFRIDSIVSRISNVHDLNGDGYDDIAVKGKDANRKRLNIFYCGPSIDTLRDLWFGVDTLSGLGFTVNTCDINNNGNKELITTENFQDCVVLFELGSDSDSIPDL